MNANISRIRLRFFRGKEAVDSSAIIFSKKKCVSLNSKTKKTFSMLDILKKELPRRLKKLQQAIIEIQADACIIHSSVNLYYLTGCVFDGYLYVHPHEAPVLFIKRPVGNQGERVEYIRKPEQIPDLLKAYHIAQPHSLLIESDIMPQTSALRLKAAFGNVEFKNASGLMRQIRSVKSSYELDEMRACAAIQARIYAQIPHLYQKGMRDIDLQIEIEYAMRKEGSIGVFRSFGENMDIFMGNVLAGDNAQEASPYDFSMGGKGLSPYLPIGASGIVLQDGMTVMIDMAGNYNPYQSDMTRTFAIGNILPEAQKMHQVSMDILHEIEDTAKSGTPCADLYAHAEAKVKQHGLEAYFMGTKQQAKFIGHGVGLEINEPPVLTPRSKETLQTGMSIAIEPKFVLPGVGALGIENTYIVTDEGLEKITLCEEKLISL